MTSPALAKRRAGSRSRQRSTALAHAAGTSGTNSCSGRGGSRRRTSTVASAVPAVSKGRRLLSISYRMRPSA